MHLRGRTFSEALFAAAYQLASSRWGVAQRHGGENLLKRLEAGFHKLPCIGGAHCRKPQAKHEPGHRPRGHLVLHDQHDAVLANHAFHFMQRLDPIRSLEFVQRMGTADHVEPVVDKREADRVSLNKGDPDFAGRIFLPGRKQHPPRKIAADADSPGMATGKSRYHRARPAANIEDSRLCDMLKGRTVGEKRPRAGFIPAGMQLDESVIEV